MKPIALLVITCCIIIVATNTLLAGDTLRICSYNLLNFPGGDVSTRSAYFRTVVHAIQPDILVSQEMISQSGVTTFLDNVMNYNTPNQYSTIPFHDGPDTDNGIFYKSTKVTFVSASYIPTALRDVAEYVLHVKGTQDTLRIYSLHLKASSGSDNEQKRLAETTILRNYLNTLPTGSEFLIVGDYNIYRSSEPAYQKLIGSETDNDGRTKDPLNAAGDWTNNSTFRFIHTQSPRVRSFGGGSTGGLDDRFDIMLTSFSLDDNLIVPSYTAFGNDGNHFNDSINRLPNNAVPDSVANALHYASDHLPVFCNFQFQGTVQLPPEAFTLLSPGNSADDQPLSGALSWQASNYADSYDVYLDQNNPPTTLVSSNQTGISFDYSLSLYSTTYYWKVIAKNSAGTTTADGAPWSFTTVGTPPANFVLLAPLDQAANQPTDGMLVWSSSQNTTTYDAYLDTINPPAALVASDVIDTVYAYSGLSPGQPYYWKVVARNQNGSTVASNAPWGFMVEDVPPVTATLNVQKGWNVLALPLAVSDARKSVLFPQAISSAFAYVPGPGYSKRDTLTDGSGYWIKFDSEQTVTITGTVKFLDTVDVASGWNLICSMQDAFPVSQITSIPPNLIQSNFFGFEHGYTPVDMLIAGKGYWVKSNEAGKIIFSQQ
ncbi:MAG: hypothetical protein EPO24_04750 [Bacteroidetes bacterium]|nr:MAG: hypothetical protein EPO24_04750 [Bacteroidota bacterium]